MIFTETKLKGAFVIELDKRVDERGFFARSWCQQEFAERGLNPKLVQCNISFNRWQGTLRGMHYQIAPYEEAKLVRCSRGALYDVIIDLRAESPTAKQWFGVGLTAANGRMLYVPEGFAHGFQTLQDETEVFYQMAEYYHPECARGLRPNDPAFNIHWPLPGTIIDDRDLQYPDFSA